ncbi:Response regulator of the LytR/AlgR family [uncultured Eubacterium sp.]|nr:Response regulator of the LytR/AlgR family [uncultured Eubacterium sp.]
MESRKYLIGVCDDDEWYRNRISRAVKLICQQMDILYELRTYDSGEAAGVMGFVTKGSGDETQRLISIFQRCIERLNPEVKLAYIEARRHQICIVSADGIEEVIACGIDMAEEKCREKKNFVRCQRSYIVNLEYVDKVIGNFDQFIMKDGTAISISRSKERKQAVKSAYASYKERQISDLFGEK